MPTFWRVQGFPWRWIADGLGRVGRLVVARHRPVPQGNHTPPQLGQLHESEHMSYFNKGNPYKMGFQSTIQTNSDVYTMGHILMEALPFQMPTC